jgi:very-short-patch-repair endonuclease
MRPKSQASDFSLADLATRQHGVIARRQLIEAGIGERAFKRLVADGHLHRIHRGVYAVGHRRLTRNGRYMAAVLACGPSAVLSHRCAADLWGLHSGGTRLEVSVPGISRRPPKLIILYQPRDLPPRDRGTIDSIPVTSLARTLVDLAAVIGPDRLGRAWEEADRVGKLDVRAVEEVLARSNGRKGTGHIRALIAERRVATDTHAGLERDLADEIRKAKLPMPAWNVLVEGYLCDAVWFDSKLIVELDSFDFHDRTRKSFDGERERHTALQLKGWQVVRLTKSQMPVAAKIISALL